MVLLVNKLNKRKLGDYLINIHMQKNPMMIWYNNKENSNVKIF